MGPSESTPSKKEHKDDFSTVRKPHLCFFADFSVHLTKPCGPKKKMAEGKKDLVDSPMVASSPILLMEEKA